MHDKILEGEASSYQEISIDDKITLYAIVWYSNLIIS